MKKRYKKRKALSFKDEVFVTKNKTVIKFLNGVIKNHESTNR